MKLAKPLVRLAVVLCMTASVSLARAEVRIGLAAPLTGPMAWAGAATERSAEFAVADLNANGGVLGEHKGINAPGVPLPESGLTDKDKADLAFGVRAGVDFVAMSLVLSAADLRQARAALREAGAADLPLVAKLERPEAIA